MKNYVNALKHQLDEAAQLGLLAATKTVYMGGGTPSLLGQDAADLAQNVSALTQPSEFSMEANPDSLSDDLLANLSKGGVTRISLGVQSFNDNELKKLGRIHSADLAYDRVLAAKERGFDVSVDLMCAIPEQTESSWEYSLSKFIRLLLKTVRRWLNKPKIKTLLGTPTTCRQIECKLRQRRFKQRDLNATR